MACPICKKHSDAKYRPFCSKRCADVDLAKWLNESYAIAGQSDDEDQAPTAPDAIKAGKLH